jgi:hypothetical protein
MAFLDDALASLLEWSTVGPALLYIIFPTYILVVYPFMLRSREQAVWAFKPLLSLEDDAFIKVVKNISKPSRRGEWTAIFLGILVLGGVLFQPWTLDWSSGYFWMSVYEVITTTIGMSMMAWIIYDTLVGIVHVSRLSRQDLKLDILNPEMMAPVANWSLGISLVFVGIFILSIISDVTETADVVPLWRVIVGYGVVIGITLLIFFLSMLGVHRVMSEAKKSKLATIRRHMSAVSSEMDKCMVGNQFSGTEKLSSNITALATYKREVQEARTWPFNAAIIRRLLASIIVPAVVYLIKIFAGLGLRF